GGEALVDHRDRRFDARVLEIEVVLADLVGEQHSLVAKRARRHRRHVELLAVLEAQSLDRVPGALADDVELALERISDRDTAAAADEYLPDYRLELDRGLRKIRVVHRNVAPAEELLPFV